MSFLSKLQNNDTVESTTEVKQAQPSSMKVVDEDFQEDGAGVTEQLESLYSDIEYMNSKFPNHTIRSLADYAKDLEAKASESRKQAASSGNVQDHGIIPGHIFAILDSLDQATADSADVGIVEVDDKGVIKLYNNYEAELAGVEKTQVFGKNFFTEVAPCTNNRLFLGAFKQGVESNAIDKKFNYTFTYKMKPTPVIIQIYRESQSNRNFIFVLKR